MSHASHRPTSVRTACRGRQRVFPYGQRKSGGIDNSFVFITIALVLCVVLCYSQYGTASYVLYAVLSIITTSVIVGAWLLREALTLYHWLAVGSALATIGLYSYGNSLR